MTQPVLGLLSTTIVLAIAVAGISLFDFATFAGWVSFVLLCAIPMQVVIVAVWGANPRFVAHLPQPWKGAALLALTLAVTAAVAPVVFTVIGQGIAPPGPVPSHFAIIVVPITFWLAIMMGGWPFTRLLRDPMVAGVAILAAAYVVTYAIFRVCFDYGFLQGTPALLPSAPAGAFHAVWALVFIVTALAVMFLVLCFDLWPFTSVPGLMTQPMLGIAWTLAALGGAAAAMGLGVGLMGLDPMIFLTRVTVPFIFGTIVVLNMLQNSLFAARAQPVKGVLNSLVAAAAGVALAQLYGVLAPVVTGPLPSGAPGYEYEIWIANALLSVTFPLLITHAAFFGYWPLAAPARAAHTDATLAT